MGGGRKILKQGAAHGGQRGESCPIRREGCRESVLGCLPRGNRAGGDLGDCSQYSARTSGPGIYDALHARLGSVTRTLPLPLSVVSLPLPCRSNDQGLRSTQRTPS